MCPLSPLSRARLAALLMLAVALMPAQAEEGQPLPTCQTTVPLPPPEPPARPDALVAERPSNPPLAEAPLPPERPTELPKVPALPSEGSSNDASSAPESQPNPASGTPLQPARPPELSATPPLELKVGAPPDAAALPSCTPTLAAPLPPSRPSDLAPSAAAFPDAPLPPSRPPDLSTAPAPADEAPLPPGRPPELSGDAAQKLTVAPPEDTACLRALDGLGVSYTKATPITHGQCTVPHPLSVSRLGNGISIGAPEIMACRLAEGLTRWTAQVEQIAEKELGEPLKGLTLGGTYVCRGQNHGSEAPLSEHAFANAVDVMGFTFGKRAPIAVSALPEGSKEAAFVAAVRSKACEFFTTVLGPGTDEQHANHLHLDERERKAGYRICQ